MERMEENRYLSIKKETNYVQPWSKRYLTTQTVFSLVEARKDSVCLFHLQVVGQTSGKSFDVPWLPE